MRAEKVRWRHRRTLGSPHPSNTARKLSSHSIYEYQIPNKSTQRLVEQTAQLEGQKSHIKEDRRGVLVLGEKRITGALQGRETLVTDKGESK